ncbi:hypothetical protein G7B40_031075 [Aetokthonos hydrillicola Thurmond2011]|uniref:Uncharacterized protein n=1 Tax=Aetokthonos hydrillicola Thurmond2011 TaxID=2712845 RepID=A0AAP5MD01_9CYAN|nr:hypothetical protein [Aetokthonos hydrillicola]MBO3462120.1 hypothetical protein [Aetokthonos hydrillicola CCALA 1050]MBW4589714.1 hypothetical protein [Aetokthonos hydrillicola CCALA 1050]MDR9898968.1 hypothetical protein [Aetokthonos hydrillicola Thurmond2011]
MLETSFLPDEGIEPRKFCRIWFGINHLSATEINNHEVHASYRRKCVKLLAQVLGVCASSVRKWGADINFSGIPHHHKLALAYALKIAVIHQINKETAEAA